MASTAAATATAATPATTAAAALAGAKASATVTASAPSSSTARTTKRADGSLWWDSFAFLLDSLDVSSYAELTPDTRERIERNRKWLRESVSGFCPPSVASREALHGSELLIGEHSLAVTTELRELALRASKNLNLDEIQSYIVVHRSSVANPLIPHSNADKFLQLVLEVYYLERQCLLKCIRRLLAFHEEIEADQTEASSKEVIFSIREELDTRLLLVVGGLFSSAFSVNAEPQFVVLWLEEVLIEASLIFDILFLVFYTFTRCDAEKWKTLLSLLHAMLSGPYEIGKLGVSLEAKMSFSHAKFQLLVILIETLDFENLLLMVRNEVLFRDSTFAFSFRDIQAIDVEMSKIADLGMVESGPLMLAWAVFLYLVTCLPDGSTSLLREIDHSTYANRASELAPFHYLLEFLCSESFGQLDGPVPGYLCVLRTFISAFISSYELTSQAEDDSLLAIINLLCHIYHGEESLCVDFWDRSSYVDSPIRSLLLLLEKDYPLQIVQFICFLSAVSKGSWPAECVYNYLERLSGITTQLSISTFDNVTSSDGQVVISRRMITTDIEGVSIPSGCHGVILKFVEKDVALIRWEHPHSGISLLLQKLAQDLHRHDYEEACHIIGFLHQIGSSSKVVCSSLLHVEKSFATEDYKGIQVVKDARIDMAKLLCSSIINFVQDTKNSSILCRTVGLLTEMMKCAPSHVFAKALDSGIFKTEGGISSGAWSLSNELSRMLFACFEDTGDCSSLTIAVLDFVIQVLKIGADESVTFPLVVFCLQHVMGNLTSRKCKLSSHWKATQKMLELVKTCIGVAIPLCKPCGGLFSEILLSDASVHNVLLQAFSLPMQYLQIVNTSYHQGLKEFEELQLILSSVLDILCSILSQLREDQFQNPPALVKMLLSSSKPLHFITSTITLLSSGNSALKTSAARIFSKLCYVASRLETHSMDHHNLVPDGLQIRMLRDTISLIIDDKEESSDLLKITTFDLLTSAACYQPMLFVSLIVDRESQELSSDARNLNNGQSSTSLNSINEFKLVDQILNYTVRSRDLIMRSSRLLLSVLELLKSVWEGGLQYLQILEKLRGSQLFWENLLTCLSAREFENHDTPDLPSRYLCSGKIFEIMADELFLQDRLSIYTNSKVSSAHSLEVVSETSRLRDIFKSWYSDGILENLLNSLSISGYDREIMHRAKLASCVCILHMMIKLSCGDTGSMSVSLVKKINEISSELREHPAFLALLSQYSTRGYSGSETVSKLIISDLYYHVQGELEGREISPGPFRQLLSFLINSCSVQRYLSRTGYSIPTGDDIYSRDISIISNDLGIEYWNHPDWKKSKELIESMLITVRQADTMMTIANAKLFALKALVIALGVPNGNSLDRKSTVRHNDNSLAVVESGIRLICKALQSTLNLLSTEFNANDFLLALLASQVALAQSLTKLLLGEHKRLENSRKINSALLLLMRTLTFGAKFFSEFSHPCDASNKAVELILLLLLDIFNHSRNEWNSQIQSDSESSLFSEMHNASLGLLPDLCKFVESSIVFMPSFALMDLIVKALLSPDVWYGILEKHLRLQVIFRNVQNDLSLSTTVLFNFLLTLGNTKTGIKILHSANVITFLKAFLSKCTIDEPFLSNVSSNVGSSADLWRLGLAVMTSMNSYSRSDVALSNIVDNCIIFLSEHANQVSSYLSAPKSFDQSKKRPRLQKSHTSLSALNLAEQFLGLVCILARHEASWTKGMSDVDSELRQTIIHLLSFISRAGARGTDLSFSFHCAPSNRKEVELNDKPPMLRSKHGWFRVAAAESVVNNGKNIGSSIRPDNQFALIIRERKAEDCTSTGHTLFTETVATQIYRISLHILDFLCIRSKVAMRRAEEIDFIDLDYFPDLPVPEILHGLQDQAIAIVTEVCEANRTRLSPEMGNVCHLLLTILDYSLCLEFCVCQSCGIRPALGRTDDFSREMKTLMQVLEAHPRFKTSADSLTKIIVLMYPRLLSRGDLV